MLTPSLTHTHSPTQRCQSNGSSNTNLEKMKDFWRETKCVICNYPNIHIQIFHYGIAAEACVFLRAKAHTLTATYDLEEEKIRVHVSEVQTDESEFSLQRTVLSHNIRAAPRDRIPISEPPPATE